MTKTKLKQKLEDYEQNLLKERNMNNPSEDAISYIDEFLELINKIKKDLEEMPE